MGEYALILGVHAVASRYQEGLNARMSLGYTQFMQDRVYTAFARVKWLYFTRMRGSEVIRVMTGDLIRAGFATRRLLELMATVVLTVIYIGVALSVSWVMTLVALACATVISLILQPLNRQAHSLGEELQTTVDDMYRVATEHLGGMKIAKIYSLEQEHARSFSAVTSRAAAKAIRFLMVDADTQMYHQLGAIVALSFFFNSRQVHHHPHHQSLARGMRSGYLTFFISVPNGHLCGFWLTAPPSTRGRSHRRKQSGLENITFGDLWINNKRNYSFK